jgi:hypothetical protein
VVNFLTHRRDLSKKTASFGKAFENWVFHELQCFLKYSHAHYSMSYWQLTSGVEVDFILGDMEIACLESKIRKTEDGILILPYQEFLNRLWAHSLTPEVNIRFESSRS